MNRVWPSLAMLLPLLVLTQQDGPMTAFTSGRVAGNLLLDLALAVLILGGVSLLTFLLCWWLLVGRHRPALVLGPEGIEKRGAWRKAIPWERIEQVRPIGRDAASYDGFVIEISGRNEFSKWAVLRWVDNWVARPLGAAPFFTVSFQDLEIEDAEAAALVRRVLSTT